MISQIKRISFELKEKETELCNIQVPAHHQQHHTSHAHHFFHFIIIGQKEKFIYRVRNTKISNAWNSCHLQSRNRQAIKWDQ